MLAGILGSLFLSVFIVGLSGAATPESSEAKQWLAGDHHVHSQYSVGLDRSTNPPAPKIGTHGTYPIPTNAQKARQFGLDWVVATDHGGREHAKINLEQAYPELVQSRQTVPDLIQYFGFEINAPGADHASVVVAHTHDEADRVYEIESQFDARGAGPDDLVADEPERMLEALEAMKAFDAPPIVIANHPSRRPPDGDIYGRTRPEALRAWNDTAPGIAVGMAGAPGRQAATLNADGSFRTDRPRGDYRKQPTFGGFDRMTAELGGFWDSMLGEGRRWWITANSDSHLNWTDGGKDFWPGEFSKTYVYAERDSGDILAGLRSGKVFVTTGDLVSELDVTASNMAGELAISGGTLHPQAGEMVNIIIRLKDPGTMNAHGDTPSVSRVDLIAGLSPESGTFAEDNTNSSARVVRRFNADSWSRNGEFLTMNATLPTSDGDFYVRVRGTNTSQLEPEADRPGENPWDDLWFYSNPIFIQVD